MYSSVTADLNVIVWIPVHVVDDDSVSWCKVNAQTTGSCRQQKYKLLRLGTWVTTDAITKIHPLTCSSSKQNFQKQKDEQENERAAK